MQTLHLSTALRGLPDRRQRVRLVIRGFLAAARRDRIVSIGGLTSGGRHRIASFGGAGARIVLVNAALGQSHFPAYRVS
jgi:hypothetical protein